MPIGLGSRRPSAVRAGDGARSHTIISSRNRSGTDRSCAAAPYTRCTPHRRTNFADRNDPSRFWFSFQTYGLSRR
eukprot:1318214-Amorphochlora_amoeboformis.AAC.1